MLTDCVMPLIRWTEPVGMGAVRAAPGIGGAGGARRGRAHERCPPSRNRPQGRRGRVRRHRTSAEAVLRGGRPRLQRPGPRLIVDRPEHRAAHQPALLEPHAVPRHRL